MLIVCDAVRIMRMTMFLCHLSIGNWGSWKCKCSDPVQPVSNCSNDGGAMVGIRFMMRVKSNCPRGKLVESKSFTSNKSHLFVQPQQLLEHLSFLRPPLHCWRRDGLFAKRLFDTAIFLLEHTTTVTVSTSIGADCHLWTFDLICGRVRGKGWKTFVINALRIFGQRKQLEYTRSLHIAA